jgi:predicted ATPase/DNA-binding CsgD family transcriptional regulator
MYELRSQHTLPTSLTPLVGRERELAAVCALLSRPEVRLVTLIGTGGVGKTRLALEVAAAASSDFADGICFVALAALTDPALVVSTIAQALGVREQGSQPRLHSLEDHLRDRQLLLLLDNFEQLVSAAPVVAELLAAAPRLQVLVTSRASLRLSGEHEFVVPPLSLPDLQNLPPLDRLTEYEAVRLFIERAQAVKADFTLTEGNGAAVAAICHQLDGLPLAIELAARRSKLFSPQALLPRLRNRLKLLVGGAREKPAHQQTLRGTIAWSYELLEEDEKTLFRRLAVFVEGCTLAAAESVCNAHGDLEGDVLDGVARLVDKSLLRQETEFDGEPRLLMLETIREYALERLAESSEADAMRRQHATFFLQVALKAYPKMFSAEQSTWYNRLEVEHANLRAALRWTLEGQEAEMGLRLVGALYRFWRLRNHAREGRSWLAQVLAQPGAQARTLARATALRGAGFLAFSQGDFPEAQRLLAESVSISREVGAAGKRELASALAALAHVTLLQGNPGNTRELAGESLRLFQEVGEAWGVALAMTHLGKATLELGDPEAARALLEESAALFRVAGDRQLLAQSLNALGLVALRQGDYAGARAHLEEALSVAQETGAEQYRADALAHLGTVALRVGDSGQSASLYQQSLALNRVLGNREGIASDLAGLAEVASLLGQPERAAHLFGAVEALREASNTRLSPLRRAAYDRTVGSIRAQLDEAAFEEARAQGRAMELSQAIVYAFETKDTLPTEASPPEACEEEALSFAPPGTLSSPPLSPRRALKQHFGGLTSREREVARLVAQGKSNRAIADELVVGVSTVEAHISHIFTKLGFSSRSQIAAWAVEKGLLQASQDVETTNQEH